MAMRKALLSLMCHPERSPMVVVPQDPGYEQFLNRTPNYSDAYRVAIAKAVAGSMDLVTADTDGYHPPAEIAKLAAGDFGEGAFLVLPYRGNIGLQSRAYSSFLSIVERRHIRDATGGLCRLSLELMRGLPPLRSSDMTVHIEILKHALKAGSRLVQYEYLSGDNDESESRRTKHYQVKLLAAVFRRTRG